MRTSPVVSSKRNSCYPLLRGASSLALRATLMLVVMLGGTFTREAVACPFCKAVGNTLTEDLAASTVAVIAERVAVKIPTTKDGSRSPDPTLKLGIFKIQEIVKGHTTIKGVSDLEILFRDAVGEPNRYLIFGSGDPLLWTTPLAITESEAEYFKALPSLPAKGAERIEKFLPYLEHADRLISEDAYDEFARAPYADVKAIKPLLSAEHLKRRLEDPALDLNHRRLYATMLGVCGTREDAPFMAERITSPDRAYRKGLDAFVGCYLTLMGEAGLPLVEQNLFTNEQAEFTDINAALTAVRFHLDEKIIPRERLIASLKLLLERPELADLVIPDFARGKVWDLLPEMEKLYVKSEKTSAWVRVPIIRYLRDNPLPEAAALIEKLREIDAESVTRAETMFPKNSFTIDETPSDGKIAATPVEPAGIQRPEEEPKVDFEPLPSESETPYIASATAPSHTARETPAVDATETTAVSKESDDGFFGYRTIILASAAILLAVLGIALFPRSKAAR